MSHLPGLGEVFPADIELILCASQHLYGDTKKKLKDVGIHSGAWLHGHTMMTLCLQHPHWFTLTSLPYSTHDTTRYTAILMTARGLCLCICMYTS